MIIFKRILLNQIKFLNAKFAEADRKAKPQTYVFAVLYIVYRLLSQKSQNS